MTTLFSKYDPVGRELKRSLAGKTAVITGATGTMGAHVATELARRGARLILQFHSRVRKACELELTLRMIGANVTMVQADFTLRREVKEFVQTINTHTDRVDFLIHAAGVCKRPQRQAAPAETEKMLIHQINQLAPIEITLGIEEKIREGTVILYLGSPSEDAPIEGAAVYGEAKKGLHHFASRYAGDARRQGVTSIYYLPGMVRESSPRSGDGTSGIDDLQTLGQRALLDPSKVARNVVASLMREPLVDVADVYEGSMLVRRDGYTVTCS
ncbi:MAG TPA: SDR family oxidoreductase [Bacteroidota bacterium]|nr:SDR family oxidoreductase [Bacteroidota bacterium]